LSLSENVCYITGTVSLLAVYNDRNDHAVEVYIDEEIWSADALQLHPLVNTATLVVPKEGSEAFLSATGHEGKIVSIPARSA
jgi:Ala-tRNA(Pro) deacylase